MLIQNLGDKTLLAVRDGYLYFKPGFSRVPLSAMRDANDMIPAEAVETIWPQANPYSETWFVDGRAYWTNLSSLFEWPLAGGDVRVTMLPEAGGWYNLAVNQQYIFVVTPGCKRIRRIDRVTGEALESEGLLPPRVAGMPTVYASDSRLYCAASDDGRLWSVTTALTDPKVHVELQPRDVVRLSLVDQGYLYFQEDHAAGGRVSRMNLKSEAVEHLFDGRGWAMSAIRKVDEQHVAWLTPQGLRVVDLEDKSLREFAKDPYFTIGGTSPPGPSLLFDADNLYWFRIDDGGHLMVTPRSVFDI